MQKGNTPADIARMKQNQEMIALLGPEDDGEVVGGGEGREKSGENGMR